ncbi:MAG: PSD1 and planctomycete cytochrome C domain-containing protein [Planctomycetaceae bacterium]|nr:PSD1 and planctomycete cytochrome C domain-containing protein [Planctomycetaceae bacterium]
MRPAFRKSAFATLICILVTALQVPSESPAADVAKVELTFEKDIIPIIKAKCIRCHAGVEPKAGLNLTSPSSLLTGGKSGAALRIRAAEFSLLYEMVSSERMPPVGQKLTANEKGLIRKWINDGASGVSNAAAIDRSDDVTDTDLWSFRPPVRPVVPDVRHSGRVRNPIDSFVLRQLEKNNLTPSARADQLTLLRRASFDLIGLPPTPAEVDRFIANAGPGAYERMIERLLASPQYGERWARHWLDVAGFTESAGILNEDRALPLAWRYRDYVIRAFNSDKPYDRFLQEQIAGDELTDYWAAFEGEERLPEYVVEGIIATGFLRTAADPSRPDFSKIKNAAAQYFYPTLFDTLQIVCSSTMGLTVQCARCHSHKFDPIPQVDYYRMQAVFTTAYRTDKWIPQMNRRLPIASRRQTEAAAEKNAEVDAGVRLLKAELAALKKTFADRVFTDQLAMLPEELLEDVKSALNTKPASRTEVQGYLAGKFKTKLRPQGKELDDAITKYPEYTRRTKDLNAKVIAEEGRRWLFDEVRALYDQPGEATTPVLLRGDALTPGPLVEPGVISTIASPEPFEWSAPGPESKTSGRRLAFARWLTQPEHPLTARVMVNRIWMHHFGTGIVATSDDFGVSGASPSHSELLDWLATEFVRSGWSVKHVHRLILNSSTWQQSSGVTEEHRSVCEKVDPDNELLWRQAMRRLEAEPLRDAILATAGTLNTPMFGAGQAVAREKDGEVIVSAGQNQGRRSIYVKILRLNPETMLEVFDQPTISVNCTQRSISTVSTQALTLLNSDSMTRAASAFASRVEVEGANDPVGRAVLTAFSREAGPAEQELLSQFFDAQIKLYLEQHVEADRAKTAVVADARHKAMADLCHMLMSSNEFVYVD